MIFGSVKLVMRMCVALALALVLYFAITFVQIWWRGHQHSGASAQAILVFGTTEDNGTPSAELRARLDEALTLYRAHRAPWVVVTGGKKPGDAQTEGQVSAAYLESHGVARSRILVGAGVDTWQNVSSVRPTLRRHHITTVITVTDPFHEFRAMAVATAQGLTPYPSPVRNSPTVNYELWRYYLKETLAVGVGRIVGYGRLSEWTTSALG